MNNQIRTLLISHRQPAQMHFIREFASVKDWSTGKCKDKTYKAFTAIQNRSHSQRCSLLVIVQQLQNQSHHI